MFFAGSHLLIGGRSGIHHVRQTPPVEVCHVKKMTPTQCKAEANACAQTRSHGIVQIVQETRFYELPLTFKMSPWRTVSAQWPVPPGTLSYASVTTPIPEMKAGGTNGTLIQVLVPEHEGPARSGRARGGHHRVPGQQRYPRRVPAQIYSQ